MSYLNDAIERFLLCVLIVAPVCVIIDVVFLRGTDVTPVRVSTGRERTQRVSLPEASPVRLIAGRERTQRVSQSGDSHILEEQFSHPVIYDYQESRNYSTCVSDLRFASKTLPLSVTALASYPGSGGPWLRYLIQQLIGYYTGSTRGREGSLLKFPGDTVTDGRVVAVNTHSAKGLRGSIRAILLLRSPSEAILARFNQSVEAGGLEKALLSKRWTKFVDKEISTWRKINNFWLEKSQAKKLIILHRDLQENLPSVLTQLCAFLEMEHECLAERLRCVADTFKVNPGYHQAATLKSVYSETARDKIQSYVREISGYLNNNTEIYSKINSVS